MVLYIKAKEQLSLSYEECLNVVSKSQNNIKTLLWNLECHVNKINVNYIFNQKIEYIVDKILNISKKKITLIDLQNIRASLYKIFITNFNEDTILNNIVENLIKKIDNIYLRQEILDISCKYYIRLNVGKRTILHLEALIFNLMHCIYMHAKAEHKRINNK